MGSFNSRGIWISSSSLQRKYLGHTFFRIPLSSRLHLPAAWITLSIPASSPVYGWKIKIHACFHQAGGYKPAWFSRRQPAAKSPSRSPSLCFGYIKVDKWYVPGYQWNRRRAAPVFCCSGYRGPVAGLPALHQMFLGYPPCQLYLCPF